MRVLLIPVSAARGFGEYARTLEIAGAIQQRWPQAQLHFILSREAPYGAQCPFAATLLPGSATLHTPEVLRVLSEFQPDIVIFDNAGRTAQVLAAHARGARVVYISSRRRQRNKAFRLRWMRALDEHWIAYPRYIAGDLNWLESVKFALLRRPRVRFIDTVLPGASLPPLVPHLQGFVLLVPGGGTPHPGALQAPQIMAEAAAALAGNGVAVVLVGSAEPAANGSFIRLPLLPQAQLVDLLRRARIIVCNGGDTLLQSLACGGACVAVPIAHDQAARIARCRQLALVREARLEARAIVEQVMALTTDERERAALIARARAAGITDARPQIIEWLAQLQDVGGT